MLECVRHRQENSDIHHGFINMSRAAGRSSCIYIDRLLLAVAGDTAVLMTIGHSKYLLWNVDVCCEVYGRHDDSSARRVEIDLHM